MGYGIRSLPADGESPYFGRMDPDWANLLQRFRALIPFGTPIKPLAAEVGLSYGYLWALIQGIKDNPSAKTRTKIARYIADHEPEGTKTVDLATSAAQTPMLTPDVTAPADTRRREVFEVPTPLHAATYNLISMLPAAVLLRLLPAVEAEVKKIIDDTPPSEPTKD